MQINTTSLIHDEAFFFDIRAFSSLSPVTRYVFAVNEIIKQMGVDPSHEKNKLFFRGQADCDWTVEPSIFRKDYLSVEHDIIRSSISRNPNEFVNGSYFAQLAKLQHYGLPTRLLDVTHSPLVALYFACAQETKRVVNDDGNVTQANCDGAVYIANANPVLPESIQTQVLSYLATCDLNRCNLHETADILQKNIPNLPTFKGLDFSEQMLELTQSHFVLADMNHERIIRQSGAFLLGGCIDIKKAHEGDFRLSKAHLDLTSEFLWKIMIGADEKETILDELVFLNINEATLFPELEHQLNYVKQSNSKRVKGVNSFAGLVSSIEDEPLEQLQQIDPLELQRFIDEQLPKIIASIVDKDFCQDILNVFIQNASTDWYKRDTIQAKLSSEITRFLSGKADYSLAIAKNKAHQITYEAVKAIYSRG